MSAIIVITPLLAELAWPVLSALIGSALANMGYNVVKTRVEALKLMKEKESIELDLKNASAVGETLGEEEDLVLTNGPVTLVFRKNPEGKCVIRVCGKGKTGKELKQIGTEAANRVIQSYVRQKVSSELKRQGFSVVEETKEADGTIKIKIRKWM